MAWEPVGADTAALVSGTPIAPGIAMGPALIRTSGLHSVPMRRIAPAEAEAEIARLHEGREHARAQILRLRGRLESEGGLDPEEIRILDTHVACLDDPVFRSDVEKAIRSERLNLEGALARVISNFARLFELIESSHLKERISDIREVASRILDHVAGGAPEPPASNGAAILVTDELRMADLLGLRDRPVAGVVAERGTRTSHASLLARSLRIPMVAGVPGITGRVANDSYLLVDGSVGAVYPDPPAAVREQYEGLPRDLDRGNDLPALLTEECRTRDGVRVGMYASISGELDASLVRTYRMDGIALFRSDAPFLRGSRLPTPDQLATSYRSVSEAAGSGPAVIRLLNLGSARGVAGRSLPTEPNPALGRRALRLLLEDEEILRLQIDALIEANATGNVHVLVPFVTDISDLERVREWIEARAREQVARGRPDVRVPELGCAVEVPGLVPMLPEIRSRVDFLTLGIDNLAQYAMAADRVNSDVARYLDPFQPGLLRLLATVFDAAGDIPLYAYGEMVRDGRHAHLLLGMGLRRFCLPPYALPRSKSILLQSDSAEARAFAKETLALRSSEEVRRRLESRNREILHAASRAG